MARAKIDPIYAATPMFTTIPQTVQEKSHRQLLGSHVRAENIKFLHDTASESESSEEVEEVEEEEKKENEDGKDQEETADNGNQFDSHSSDEDKNGDNDVLDDDNKGVVEQIFNRDRKT